MTSQVDIKGNILSADTKPRLKWTRNLHEQFVDAVKQIGGAEKATPKLVMQVMAVPGITLFHLKSHLQKYRLAKSRDPSIPNDDKKIDELEDRDNKFQPHLNEAMMLQQIQMDVQRKLHEQIEVQKHLQLRIEAQGKYLQSVLKNAEETLAGYNSSTSSSSSSLTEAARTELSELVSTMEGECMSSSFFHGGIASKRNCMSGDSSMESCMTSEKLELRERDAAGQRKQEASSVSNPFNSRTLKTREYIEEEIDLNK